MDGVLVLGNGYLGKEFARRKFEVWGRDKFEFQEQDNVYRTWKLIEPALQKYHTIVNCIAKSNTRWCEDPANLKEALFINGQLPACLSTYCRDNNKKFVHISTGCLYDDDKNINAEDSFIAAHCTYTVTKWVGEKACRPERDLILRPRLLFSDVEDKNNLLCKLPKYKGYVSDKQDSLTCTTSIVAATKELLKKKQVGVFNIAEEGSLSIADIAELCGGFGKKNVKRVRMSTVREAQGLYLVNNVMSIDKLKQFYSPFPIDKIIKVCYTKLNESK
jgi:dTDP-4-dehydrorhamnose reductase